MKHHKHGGRAHHAKGGTATGGQEHPDVVSGNPNVLHEAAEHKKGGKVKKHHRKAGGKVLGLMTGGSVRPRMDRPGRKHGGGVGSNMKPLSTAHGSGGAGKEAKTEEGGQSPE